MHTSTADSTRATNRWPPEWEPHAATLVAWPGRASVWQHHLSEARSETATLVAALARSEPVLLATPADQARAVTETMKHHNVRVITTPLDDCWARDIAPLWVTSDGDLIGVDFRFNAWGNKFTPHAADAAFAAAICQHLRCKRIEATLTLEGGSLSNNGAGLALAVKATLLNGNRNPGVDARTAERSLRDLLGVTKIIWLRHGLLGDTDTDGHVDNVACFVDQDRVLAQSIADRHHPDFERLQANLRVLRAAHTQDGRRLDVIEMPWLPTTPLDPTRPSSYLNFCITNEAVLLPVVGAGTDDQACELVGSLFPKRSVVPVPARALAYGGGGPHCMTMQIPVHPSINIQGDS